MRSSRSPESGSGIGMSVMVHHLVGDPWRTRARRAACPGSPEEPVDTMTPVLTADPAAPLVVLSPHLDDAVWACFSLLGDGVIVATAFAGIPEGGPGWWDAQCGITNSAAHVRARRAEDAAVPERLGARPVHLPLLDGQYRDGEPAAADVVEALRERVPAVSRVVAWAG